jgi:hypothetical protein
MLVNKRRFSRLCDRFFRGRDSKVEQGELPFFLLPFNQNVHPYQSKSMAKSNKASCKILPFVVPQAAMEGKLEKWFRGVIQSNHDLTTALERLRDSYRELLANKPLTEADQAVLLAVQITLTNARNARTL